MMLRNDMETLNLYGIKMAGCWGRSIVRIGYGFQF